LSFGLGGLLFRGVLTIIDKIQSLTKIQQSTRSTILVKQNQPQIFLKMFQNFLSIQKKQIMSQQQTPSWYAYSLRSILEQVEFQSKLIHQWSKTYYDIHGRGVFRVSYKKHTDMKKIKLMPLEYTPVQHLEVYGSNECRSMVRSYNPETEFIFFLVCRQEDGDGWIEPKSTIVKKDVQDTHDPEYIELFLSMSTPFEHKFTPLTYPPEKLSNACRNCKYISKTKNVCSRCKSVNYCCKGCQVKDWVVHKHVCESLQNT
jgi:hypothetical protein